MTLPIVDHSPLSPNGRVSKKARESAIEKTRRALFGDGLAHPRFTPTQEQEREFDLQRAADLERLADQGIRPVVHRREAKKLRDRWHLYDKEKI